MKKQLPFIFFFLVLIGCGGKKNNPNPTLPSPSKASLTFPDQNAVCTNGTVISETESSVTFKWEGAANTDSYDLYLKTC